MRINTRIGGRIIIIFFTIIIPLSTFAGVSGTLHDLTPACNAPPSGACWGGFAFTPTIFEPCVFCHTPHQGETPQIPTLLWNRNAPSGAYSMYGPSPTMDATVPPQPNNISKLCLGCHDGISALNAIYNAPGPGSYVITPDTYFGQVYYPNNVFGVWYPGVNIGEQYDGNVGTVTLSNDHPVSIQYRNDLDAELRTPTTVGTRTWVINGAVRLPLYGPGPNPMLECPSCHDVHNTVDYPNKGTTEVFFLRSSNEGSQLCMTCHLK